MKNNLVITKSTVLCSGTVTVTDSESDGIIQIKASNIVVDGSNVKVIGGTLKGYGVVEKGFNNVTIRNMNISNFVYGMKFENGYGHLIEKNILSNNKKETTGFLDINRPLATAYGGGLLLNNVASSSIQNNTLKNQNTGVDVYYGAGNIIKLNDASSNTAWGVRLYSTVLNTVSDNQLHHVNRCNNTGCDSAGILLAFNSNNNIIRNNNLTNSGDGFFIGNENGGPSNDNTIENNDGSHAANNAFEATFSSGNTFRGNTASFSNYGFWLGFSHDSTLDGNTILSNATDGINWEHGRYGVIQNNTVKANGRYGLSLTLNPTNPLIPRYPGSEASHNFQILNNTFDDNNRGIYTHYTTDSTMTGNHIDGNSINLYFEDVVTNQVSSGSAVFGKSTIGGSIYPTGDSKFMVKYTLNASASASNITMYGRWDGNGLTGDKGFIYADNNGTPGALVAVTQPININSTTLQWWTLPFAAPIQLQSGTYWLGILMEEPGTYIAYDLGDPNMSAGDLTGEPYATGPEDPASPVYFEDKAMSVFVGTGSGTPTYASSNNVVNSNNILCSSITGHTCLLNVNNNSGKTVDMKNNWWGTTDTNVIDQLIFDNKDNASLAPVTYTPIRTSSF